MFSTLFAENPVVFEITWRLWNKKPTRCHLVLYLFLLYKLLNMHYTTRGKNTTKSSAPEDGLKVARNMLSNL